MQAPATPVNTASYRVVYLPVSANCIDSIRYEKVKTGVYAAPGALGIALMACTTQRHYFLFLPRDHERAGETGRKRQRGSKRKKGPAKKRRMKEKEAPHSPNPVGPWISTDRNDRTGGTDTDGSTDLTTAPSLALHSSNSPSAPSLLLVRNPDESSPRPTNPEETGRVYATKGDSSMSKYAVASPSE
ncbi:hypothetical protein P152DRAFT_448427 [Eremomyces bilateralis CBS 781.70]|uniref:Uncharacterized protein n=1 Tax=Eremomyces bilateralis CBS 781.70 TaxID=1392243 RepID=A0A6G1G7K5_9PEZI|nr:uncharacterized protein P152DRAFT_448427 [Eremomyces bilateralis CBS 781.70]KAF1814075.1 hypothetical protein P152DRAFT_448427 [Eremomyces bilateralis CBS 781.70]